MLEVLLTTGFPRKQTPLACLFGSSHDKEKKRRKAWVREYRVCSYMPPFFFDFFFLAFVGLFTRLYIYNGLCLRNLLFFRKSIFRDRIFLGWTDSMPDLEIAADFSSPRYSRAVQRFFSFFKDESLEMIFLLIRLVSSY